MGNHYGKKGGIKSICIILIYYPNCSHRKHSEHKVPGLCGLGNLGMIFVFSIIIEILLSFLFQGIHAS